MADWSRGYSVPVTPNTVAIQGQEGSFSHIATRSVFDQFALRSFDAFEGPFDAVLNGDVDIAVIPVQNTIADRVPYVLSLIRAKGLKIIGEYFLPIEHCLLTLPGADIEGLTHVHSHPHALAQCSGFFNECVETGYALAKVQNADTAGSAKMIATLKDPTQAAIAPALAAAIYGLDVRHKGIQDNDKNITRFLIFARDGVEYEKERNRHYVTTLIIKPKRSLKGLVKRQLAVLTVLDNNNLVCSSINDYTGILFRNEGMYMELIGHPEDRRMKRAMDQLNGICSEVTLVGLYPTHHFHRFPDRNPFGIRPA